MDWERRRILIWGKTRPELSQTYREIVCTGGVFADTKRLVRVYPIPLRYLDDTKYFRKYQWIEAFVKRSDSDPRPESYKIRADGIDVFDAIPTQAGNWDARAEWLFQPGNIFDSVEALQDAQAAERTSLGLVRPRKVTNVRAVAYTKPERDSFWTRYKSAVAQMQLPIDEISGREIKPLSPPDYRFQIAFECSDARCRSHSFSVLDWELDALYFHQVQQGRSRDMAAAKVVEKLEELTCADKDFHMFLGNISSHPQVFTIVGLWYPKRKPASTQLSLL